ncbi:AMP-binding protein [Amycolatopsis sp. NBC_01488]|uniref:AMP-binding protein n=1 Tax=Amycolatopsis sp. NBC_01488 TaxID=2903563 RepID=UPI002E2C56D3|nr:AMP-binding protein [Amycolatopsis sp. NBC_01488]
MVRSRRTRPLGFDHPGQPVPVEGRVARDLRGVPRANARLAGGLRELGVTEGDTVLVMLPNGPEIVHAWFACNALGAPPHRLPEPSHPAAPAHRDESRSSCSGSFRLWPRCGSLLPARSITAIARTAGWFRLPERCRGGACPLRPPVPGARSRVSPPWRPC